MKELVETHSINLNCVSHIEKKNKELEDLLNVVKVELLNMTAKLEVKCIVNSSIKHFPS